MPCSFRLAVLGVLVVLLSGSAFAQNAQFSGEVTDAQKAVVPNAEVRIVNQATGVETRTKTNGSGLYVVPYLIPGIYKIFVQAPGFETAASEDLTVTVGQVLILNFQLRVGQATEKVTVYAGSQVIDTTDATVSTVVDRQFADNLPMNGRSFQTLIQLTPGVVLTSSTQTDSGQFSVNGQRANANYWMVDGVSANIGVSSSIIAGNGFGGSLSSFSVLGGTNSLVSVDALQEFRIQTSTYAPEFGRTPGGQISIVTRQGTNQFHGTAFDYFRNDVLDASDWFNGFTNNPALPKAEERQNDFGGTLNGPILKDRTFFFFSYEGLRLRLPQTALTTVPDLNARQNGTAAMQPFLNAFPVPNGPDNVATGIAQFNSSFSNKASLDAYSLRIDHKLKDKVTLFGRYNYSPSDLTQRGGGLSLSTISPAQITTQTGTLGTTWSISSATVNDFRFNYSRTNASSSSFLDNFGGAVPLASPPFPTPFTSQNAQFFLNIVFLKSGQLSQGQGAKTIQRQINVVDNLSIQRGRHSLKFGVDFRRLSPTYDPAAYAQRDSIFGVPPPGQNGNLIIGAVFSNLNANLVFHNLGIYAEDTWRVMPRLTISYGLRWDVDFAPSSSSGPSLNAVTGYNLADLSNLALAPVGTPPFKTTYGNVAPRVGIAYQLTQNQEWGTVLRGGFGVFYDLATQEVGNTVRLQRL